MTRTVDCIYCCKAGPYSREHVLQKSLGGNLTAPVACDACNQRLSRIDQALAEQSMVALDRTLQTPSQHPVRLGNLHFMHRPESDLWEEVQVTNRFSPRVPAQLHFRRPHVWFFAQDNDHKTRFAALLEKRIADGKVGAISIRVAPAKFCTTIRLVQHRHADMFVRAHTIEDGKEFLGRLPTLWNEIKTRFAEDMTIETIESPQVYVRLSISFDDVHRAVAKIAFNYLALRKGIAFARRSEFDPIRRYILGHDIQHAPPQNDEEVAIDKRFVRALKRGELFLMPTSDHLVMVGYSHPNVFASVTLYGKHTFVVHLGEVEFESIMDFLPEGHEFSIDATSHRAIDMFEMTRRIRGDTFHEPADPDRTR